MNKKIRMKRHETFSIREGWLTKGIISIKNNENVFSSKEATDILGIGSNMVKSLKYWLLATNIIEYDNRKIQLSKFGNLLYTYDPYLEDIFSWWMIHTKMILNKDYSYIYNVFFNKCLLNTFSKRDIFDNLSYNLLKEKIDFNEKTLYDEVNMIIKTYLTDGTIDNPENNYVCPLSDLNLIKKIDINCYERNRPTLRSLNYLIVYYVILLLIKDKNYIEIDELLKADNSPGKILNLDKNLVNEYLDEMKKFKLIAINRTAGINTIYIKKTMSLEEIMNEYYK